jgi:uncharacterized protein with HEPN domain
MKPEKDLFFLHHIYSSILKIEELCKSASYNNFLSNWIIQDAVIRNLEIIGEASKNISSELKSAYKEVNWKDAAGMRNFLIHEYFVVDYEIVWNTIQNDLLDYKKQIEYIALHKFGKQLEKP